MSSPMEEDRSELKRIRCRRASKTEAIDAVNGAFDWEETIRDLEDALEAPPKQRKERVGRPVRAICQEAQDNGLAAERLDRVLSLVLDEHNRLGQSSAGDLLRTLYPSEKIKEESVSRVVASLGHSAAKPAPQLQILLLKWLVLVYGHLENVRVLSQLYGVLFNLLGFLSLRPALCQLLALITRRKHVKPYRIQTLLESQRDTGDERPLLGLLWAYKQYDPEIIVGWPYKGFHFSRSEQEWRAHHEKLLTRVSGDTSANGVSESRLRSLASSVDKASTIPDPHTARVHEDAVTIEEIESVEELALNLAKIELPSQAISILRSPMLQRFLALRPFEIVVVRMTNWLSSYFQDEVTSKSNNQRDEDDGSLSEVLRLCVEFLDRSIPGTEAPQSTCENFLRAYLRVWDGVSDRDAFLGMVSRLLPRPFEDVKSEFLSPLETAMLDGTDDTKIALLQCYTSLCEHWTRDVSSNQHSLSALCDHTSLLCLSLLDSSTRDRSEPAPRAISAILSFYETMSRRTLAKVVIPPPQIIYRCIFTSHTPTLSRMCGILASCKIALERALTNPKPPTTFSRPEVDAFNGYIMDTSNFLWRERGFNTQDTNARGGFVTAEQANAAREGLRGCVEDVRLESAFSLANHPALVGVGRVDGMEGVKRPEAGREGKMALLSRLEGRAPGVAELMRCSIKELKRRSLTVQPD